MEKGTVFQVEGRRTPAFGSTFVINDHNDR